MRNLGSFISFSSSLEGLSNESSRLDGGVSGDSSGDWVCIVTLMGGKKLMTYVSLQKYANYLEKYNIYWPTRMFIVPPLK